MLWIFLRLQFWNLEQIFSETLSDYLFVWNLDKLWNWVNKTQCMHLDTSIFALLMIQPQLAAKQKDVYNFILVTYLVDSFAFHNFWCGVDTTRWYE